MKRFKINLQLFADEEQPKEETIDDAIALTVQDLQQKLEEQTRRAEKAEKQVVDLTKVMRNMPVTKQEEEKPKKEATVDELLNKIYK